MPTLKLNYISIRDPRQSQLSPQLNSTGMYSTTRMALVYCTSHKKLHSGLVCLIYWGDIESSYWPLVLAMLHQHIDQQIDQWQWSPLIARFLGPTWAHLGPTGPRWAPRWPHELCYLGHITVLDDLCDAERTYWRQLTLKVLMHTMCSSSWWTMKLSLSVKSVGVQPMAQLSPDDVPYIKMKM